MTRSSWFKLLLAAALAVSTMVVIGAAAGAEEGRDPGLDPGPAAPAPETISPVERGEWDGDGPAPRDQVILDDLIVDGSLCVGIDCVNGESFGFDTIRLKENNLRIKFQDTSTSASFPSNDWQITVNDSSNGGANKFAIDDIDGGKTPFTIRAGARSNSIFVNASGKIGFGTNTPVVDLHVKTGNTPTLRLEQDGSSGFTAQTWDVAGNEANFFIRDATNGSTLPFRIQPGAPSNVIYIESTGDVGFGTTNPGNNGITIDKSSPTGTSANVRLKTSVNEWTISANGSTGALVFSVVGSGNQEMALDASGNLTIFGNVIIGGTCSAGGGSC